MQIHSLLFVLLAAAGAPLHAQVGDLVLRCNGSIETFGSKAPRTTKKDAFDLKVSTSSGVIEGGFAELITNTDNFSPRTTETEFSATAHGKTLLPKVFLLPGASYSLSRFTGAYSLRAGLHFSDTNDFSETSVKATCEPTSRKF